MILFLVCVFYGQINQAKNIFKPLKKYLFADAWSKFTPIVLEEIGNVWNKIKSLVTQDEGQLDAGMSLIG